MIGSFVQVFQYGGFASIDWAYVQIALPVWFGPDTSTPDLTEIEYISYLCSTVLDTVKLVQPLD